MPLTNDELVELKQKLSTIFLANLQNNITSAQLDDIWANFRTTDKLILARSFIRRNTEGTDVLVAALTKNFQILADKQADAIIKAGSADLVTLLLIVSG